MAHRLRWHVHRALHRVQRQRSGFARLFHQAEIAVADQERHRGGHGHGHDAGGGPERKKLGVFAKSIGSDLAP